MAERFPLGKGPKCGKCPECGGSIQCDWKCTIAAEYHCTHCGMVFYNFNGVHSRVHREEVKPVVDAVFNEIGEKMVDGKIFITLVDQVFVRMSKVHIPVISKKDLEKWGYVLEYGMIRRRQ